VDFAVYAVADATSTISALATALVQGRTFEAASIKPSPASSLMLQALINNRQIPQTL
jgi:hypothetical protein